MINITIVFIKDEWGTVHLQLPSSLSLKEVHDHVEKHYSGVAYIAFK